MEEENLDFVDKKSKGKIVAIIIFIIGLISILGGVGYYLFEASLTPENYLKTVTRTLNSYVEDTFASIPKTTPHGKESMQTGNITLKTDNKDLTYLNDFALNYTLGLSNQKEEMSLNLKLLQKENSLLDGTLSINKNNLYLKSDDIYANILKLSTFNENIFEVLQELEKEKYSLEDYRDITKSYITNILEALKEADLKKENVSLGEVKYIYKLTDENILKIQNKFLDLCKNDAKLKDLFQDSKSEDLILPKGQIELVINRFQKEIMSLKADFSSLKVEITRVSKGEYDVNSTILDTNTKGKLKIKDKKITYEEYNNEQVVRTFTLENKDKTITFNLVSDNEINISIKNISENDLRISLNVKDKKENISFDLDGDIKNTDNQQEIKFLANIKNKEEQLDLTLEAKTNYGDDLITVEDYSTAVEYETLSEEEKNSITENILLKLLESSLLNNLEDNANL